MLVAEHTSWLGRPQAFSPLILFLHCLPPIMTLLWTPFRGPSAPFFQVSPGRSRKVLGQKSPILHALRERPKNFCEIWTTVYSGHETIADASVITVAERLCEGKLAKYGVLVNHLSWHGVSTQPLYVIEDTFIQFFQDVAGVPIGFLRSRRSGALGSG